MKIQFSRGRQNRILGLHRDDCGSAAIEFAIFAPIMVILILGTVEIGLDMIVDASVQLAAQQASRSGLIVVAPVAPATRASQAQAIAMNILQGWTNIGAQVSITELDFGSYGNGANAQAGIGNLGDVVSYNISVTMPGFSGIPQLFGIPTLTFQRNYLVQNESE